MQTARLFKHWDEVRAGLIEALEKLDHRQLDFVPGPGLWSLKETVCHIAETERGWFRYAVARQLGSWEEAEISPGDFSSLDTLKSLLKAVHSDTEAMFQPDPDAFNASKVRLPWGAKVTVEDVVWHVIEHEIHHRGEIYLMLGMQGIEAPDV